MDETRMTIRIPDDLLERLRGTAETARRSVHGEIIWLLERAVDAVETVNSEPPTTEQMRQIFFPDRADKPHFILDTEQP